MPIHKVDGGYRWGSHGHIYHGPDARSQALKQARAAYAHGYTGDKLRRLGKKMRKKKV